MTSNPQRVLEALWDDAPMSVHELCDYFQEKGEPMDHKVIRSSLVQLLGTGRVAVHSHMPEHKQACRYAPTGKENCEIGRADIIRLILAEYASGCSFDQSQVAIDIGISHDAARAAITEMRRVGLAVRTKRTPGHNRLTRYILDPRKAAIF